MDNILKQEEQEDKLSKQRKQEEQEQSRINHRGENHSQGGIATSSESPLPPYHVNITNMAFAKHTKFLVNRLKYQNLPGKIVARGKALDLSKQKSKRLSVQKEMCP